MIVRRLIWSAMGIGLMLALVGSFEWAPASALRLGQSVPTRTPTPEPSPSPSPTARPTDTPAPEPAPPSVEAAPVPTATAAPVLLPEAGGASNRDWLVALLGGGAILIGIVWRHRHRVNSV